MIEISISYQIYTNVGKPTYAKTKSPPSSTSCWYYFIKKKKRKKKVKTSKTKFVSDIVMVAE